MGDRVVSCHLSEEYVERLDRLCVDLNECVKTNYYFRSSLMAQMLIKEIEIAEEMLYGKRELLPQRPLKHIMKSAEIRKELPEYKPARLDL